MNTAYLKCIFGLISNMLYTKNRFSMKKFYLSLFVLACLFVTTTSAQTSADVPRHNIGIGPLAGYDYEIKGATYGAGLMYEFRPFRKLGFTAGLTYEQTRKNMSDIDYGPAYGDVWKHNVYSLSLGARYYIGDFYLGGALGLGHDSGKIHLQDGSHLNGGSAYSLYRSLGAGYQIPLRNRDVVEIEAGAFGTSKAMKLGGAVRYKLRR